MFIGPYDQDAAWDTKAIGGVYRFLNRCWTLVFGNVDGFAPHAHEGELAGGEQSLGARGSDSSDEGSAPMLAEASSRTLALRHKTIKKVTEDIHRCSFNTAVAALREYVNELYKTGADRDDLTALAKLLKPFAPHLASEMLEKLGEDDVWPVWEEKYLVADQIEIVVQVNGKLRGKIQVAPDDLQDEAKLRELALADANVQKFIAGKEIRKVIVPKGAKLLNIVV